MQTGKKINQISNRLRRRSRAIQETIGISGAQGNILNYILVDGRKRPVYQKDIEKEFGLRPFYGYGSAEKSGSQGSHLPDQ